MNSLAGIAQNLYVKSFDYPPCLWERLKMCLIFTLGFEEHQQILCIAIGLG